MPSTNKFPLQRLASKDPPGDTSAHHRKTKLQRKYDFMPTLTPLNFTVTTFIEGCSRSDPD